MIVVDASAMAEILLLSEIGRRAAERVLTAKRRHVPHLLDIEVASTLRRFVLRGHLGRDAALAAVEDLRVFPVRRHAHGPLLERVFELRGNLTAYDALYVALAEALEATLVTCDSALVDVPGVRARVELLR